jgi:hypothetical protein
MGNITQVVNLVEEKLKMLLENYIFLKDENEFLYNKVAILESQIAKEKELFNDLEKKFKTLRIAKTIEGSRENNRDTKLKINSLIRQVDGCIIHLSE